MTYGTRRHPLPSGAGSPAQADANDAFDMATQFEQRDDLPAAQDAYRAADELGHAGAAVNLGVLVEERDDLAGAEQGFRRTDERGDATGPFTWPGCCRRTATLRAPRRPTAAPSCAGTWRRMRTRA
jgi:hypothetical protein